MPNYKAPRSRIATKHPKKDIKNIAFVPNGLEYVVAEAFSRETLQPGYLGNDQKSTNTINKQNLIDKQYF